MSENTESTNAPAIYGQLAQVMADCTHVAKRDRNEHQRFLFRGIDAVVNAVGPILREHKVIVLPQVRDVTYEQVATSGGKASTACRVLADYVFVSGVDGSTLTATVAAESWDTGDKATPKAMSVAFRTALLQALALPTDEPDPDSHTYVREAGAAQSSPAGGGTQRVERPAAGMTREQNAKLHMLLKDLGAGDDRDAARVWVGWALTGSQDDPVDSIGALSKVQASRAIDVLGDTLARRQAQAGQDGGRE